MGKEQVVDIMDKERLERKKTIIRTSESQGGFLQMGRLLLFEVTKAYEDAKGSI